MENVIDDGKIIDDIRYDDKTDEFSLVFKGYTKFDNFLKRIMFLTEMFRKYEEEKKIQRPGKAQNHNPKSK